MVFLLVVYVVVHRVRVNNMGTAALSLAYRQIAHRHAQRAPTHTFSSGMWSGDMSGQLLWGNQPDCMELIFFSYISCMPLPVQFAVLFLFFLCSPLVVPFNFAACIVWKQKLYPRCEGTHNICAWHDLCSQLRTAAANGSGNRQPTTTKAFIAWLLC